MRSRYDGFIHTYDSFRLGRSLRHDSRSDHSIRKGRETMADETTTTEETTQLQQTVTDVTIASPESGNPAGAASSSDESGDAQGKIIEQQQSTIDALLARTEQLTKQLNMLVAQGVQITDETPNAQQHKASTEDDYVSLSDLGRNIGKPNKVGE